LVAFRFVTSLALLAAYAGCSPQQAPAADGGKAIAGIRPAASLDIGAYKGKVVLLNFWATWCGPCRIEIPDLVRLNQQFDHSEVAIIGVSLDKNGTPDELRIQLEKFVKEYKIDYPIFLDNEGLLHAEYGSFAFVPATFLIDRNGQVANSYWGVKSFREFERGIEALLRKT
jgi:thiol-disulfide isomerase/thioredoxin